MSRVRAPKKRPRPSVYADLMLAAEARILQDALARHAGDVSKTAKELGLSRRGLTYKLERHDLGAFVSGLRESARSQAAAE